MALFNCTQVPLTSCPSMADIDWYRQWSTMYVSMKHSSRMAGLWFAFWLSHVNNPANNDEIEGRGEEKSSAMMLIRILTGLNLTFVNAFFYKGAEISNFPPFSLSLTFSLFCTWFSPIVLCPYHLRYSTTSMAIISHLRPLHKKDEQWLPRNIITEAQSSSLRNH